MTKEELFRAVGEVREDQIMEAERMRKGSRPWRRYGALAACLAVVLAGAFALERERKWAVLLESFYPADHVEVSQESAPAGGEDTGGSDGADYHSASTARPASHYSVNVEIGELVDTGAEKRPDIDEDQSGFISSSSCLAWLSPEEIFAMDTAIFRGTVRALRYYTVESGGFATQYTVADVEVTDHIRGDVLTGEIRTVLYMGGPDMTTSISGPLERLEVGSDAIFMPITATAETGRREGDSYFCYADLGELYLSEGLRFVFLDTGEGLEFEKNLYEDIADAETLDEVAAYIREMTGEPERARPAAVPAEPQAAPADTAEAAPDAASGPAGARELPGGALVGDERGDWESMAGG